MRKTQQQEIAESTGLLDLVVPFTTRVETLSALRSAERFACGLSVSIRLLLIEIVPYPLEIKHPAVRLDFLRRKLGVIESHLPLRAEIVLARDYESELRQRLTSDSVVVLPNQRGWWFSRVWRLAARLRRAGHKVILVNKENNIA